ncbi:MAG: hypothetical protein M0R28_17665 [Pigmentiphaga sp.]|nr:hypothetical protein [Pigmentiphaga sp.]
MFDKIAEAYIESALSKQHVKSRRPPVEYDCHIAQVIGHSAAQIRKRVGGDPLDASATFEHAAEIAELGAQIVRYAAEAMRRRTCTLTEEQIERFLASHGVAFYHPAESQP